MSEPAKKPSAKPSRRLRALGIVALIGPLFIMLAGAIWLAIRTWIETTGTTISANGYVAMALGVGFSLALGCGLMALVFYSSRHGYDEPSRIDTDHD